ncbi:phospholipid scramblase 1, partial [Rhizophlyctis rosea]
MPLHPVSDTARDITTECAAYSEHLQNLLAEDKALWPKYLPVTAENDLFTSLQDGILLSHLINAIRPKTVDLSKLTATIDPQSLSTKSQSSSKSFFEATHNLNTALEALKSVPNIVVVNVGAEDFLNKKTDLVLGVLWQIVRAHLLSEVQLSSHPELVRLLDLEKGETLQGLLGLSSEQILVRWFNYHLVRSGVDRKVGTIAKDVTDGTAYLLLLREVAPGDKKEEVARKVEQALKINESDKEARAKAVLEVAEILGVRKFVTAKDITEGHARLNFAFVATIFSKHIGIHLPTEDQSRALQHRVSLLESQNSSLQSQTTSLQSRVKELETALAESQRVHTDIQLARESEKTMLETQAETSKEIHRAALDGANAQIAALNGEVEAQRGAYEALKNEQAAFRKQVGQKLGEVRAVLQ